MASPIHQRVRLHLLRRNPLRRMLMWNKRSKPNQNLSQNRKRRWW
ncbi:unnamed protein product [Meloidogyne enterolobii]|uniref:Uncharacterized protein n=1 Tax=Meloidogyne enterolobii TaxID=390850 RepID=A0ACB1A8D7_MELEN